MNFGGSAARPLVVLCGIGGYGEMYLAALLQRCKAGKIKLEGVVDPRPENCRHLEQVRESSIPIYPTLDDYYRKHSADLTVISSPIHHHFEQTLAALARGSHVLCEKPAAATIQEVRRMIDEQKKSGLLVEVGFQWSFSSVIQRLKEDILNGRFGRPIRLATLHLWPRDTLYYVRNDWAGRMRTSEGRMVLDSAASNAFAHELHNMFYLLGQESNTSAAPVEVTAELYRAYPIESFDTAFCRCRTEAGTDICYIVSHASRYRIGPYFRFEFEGATVFWDECHPQITAERPDGTHIIYGDPNAEAQEQKLDAVLEALAAGRAPVCGLEAALPQVLCVNGMMESSPEITAFPEGLIRTEAAADARRLWVAGLEETAREFFARGRLPSEMGISWARPGRTVSLENFTHYPSFRE